MEMPFEADPSPVEYGGNVWWQGRIQELITKDRRGAQEYEYNYKGRGSAQEYEYSYEGRGGCTRV